MRVRIARDELRRLRELTGAINQLEGRLRVVLSVRAKSGRAARNARARHQRCFLMQHNRSDEGRPLGVAKITINRPQRDALHWWALVELERDELHVREHWLRVRGAGELLDQIGWSCEDSRQGFPLIVDPAEFERALYYALDDLEQALRDEAYNLARYQAGEVSDDDGFEAAAWAQSICERVDEVLTRRRCPNMCSFRAALGTVIIAVVAFWSSIESSVADELRFVSMEQARATARYALKQLDNSSDRAIGHRSSFCERRSSYLVRCVGHILWSDGDDCVIRVNVTHPGARYRYDTAALRCR
jgi:hypothetical protein